MLGVLESVAHQHDPRLLTLVTVIGAVIAFATVSVLARVRLIARPTLLVWLGAALVFGCALWALHFAALLGLLSTGTIVFDLPWVLASLAAAAAGSTAGFALFMHYRGRLRGVLGGGALLGAGVVGAHVCGILAARPEDAIVPNPALLAPAALCAVGFAMLTLARVEGARSVARRLEASTYLLLAIGGPYVIAMSGATFTAAPAGPVSGTLLGAGSLPLALGASGLAILLLSVASDVLDRHTLQRARQDSERLLQLVGAAFEGILILRDGIILDSNEEFRRLGGWTEEQLRERSIEDLLAEAPGEEKLRQLITPPERPPPLAFELTTADGRQLPVEIVMRAIDYADGLAYVAGIRDLSVRLQAEERIRHLAHHDALTGLPNRVLLTDRLTNALALAKRNDTNVAVFQLDLDRFKAVNDLLGHDAGDALLIEVGKRLAKTLRATDTLARLGGDEFAIIQPLLQHPHEAAALASRVIEALSVPFEIDGQEAGIGVSIGIAVHPQDGETATELLHNADTAMYRAKQEGTGSFLFFEMMMDRQVQERRHLEQDLRLAMARNELEVHYQPLFDCDNSTVVGFEALMRWQHPTRGMISPAEFIPIAEECGLIQTLGRWVLERACAEAASWQSPHRIAVNLSPTQFRQADLPQMVGDILARTGLAPERLELEITEGVLIDNTERAIEVLAQLKKQGINISLDDFGTGYSSLSYLRRFPFDKIKIDKAFINGLGEDDEAAAIVRAIVALGQSLRLSITAEGVETNEQLAMLRTLECNHVQGFLLGRPMPQQLLAALAAARGGPATATPDEVENQGDIGGAPPEPAPA